MLLPETTPLVLNLAPQEACTLLIAAIAALAELALEMDANSELAAPLIKTFADAYLAEPSVQETLPMEPTMKAHSELATPREPEFADTILIPTFGSSAPLEAPHALPEIPSHLAVLLLKLATDSLDSVRHLLPQHAMAKPTIQLHTHAPSTIKELKSFAQLDLPHAELLVSAHLNTVVKPVN
jgi:hypothetical protein